MLEEGKTLRSSIVIMHGEKEDAECRCNDMSVEIEALSGENIAVEESINKIEEGNNMLLHENEELKSNISV